MCIKMEFELRKGIKRDDFDWLIHTIQLRNKNFSQTFDTAILDDFEYYHYVGKKKYQNIAGNIGQDKCVNKKTIHITDSLNIGVDISLIHCSYVDYNGKRVNLYYGVWLNIDPEKLLNTTDTNVWKELMLKKVDKILEQISDQFPSTDEFTTNNLISRFQMDFETPERSLMYIDLLAKSMRVKKYNIVPDEEYLLNLLARKEWENGFILCKKNHSITISLNKNVVELSLRLYYSKLYYIKPTGVRQITDILDSLEKYAQFWLLKYFNKLYGKTSYYSLSDIKEKILNCPNIKIITKEKLLVLVKESSSLGSISNAVKKLSIYEEFSNINHLLKLMFDKLGVNPFAIVDDSLSGKYIARKYICWNVLNFWDLPIIRLNKQVLKLPIIFKLLLIL